MRISRRVYNWVVHPLGSVPRAGRKASQAYRSKRVKWSRSQFLYVSSALVLLFFVVGFFVITPVDILPQSFQSGQFWNSIIVCVSIGLMAAWILFLSLVRRIDVSRSLARIPRGYQLGQRDMSKPMWETIVRERDRCSKIFFSQCDFSAVKHPGLQNPHALADSIKLEVSFAEIIQIIPPFIEEALCEVDPQRKRPSAQSLRGYLAAALADRVIASEASFTVSSFIEMYERARYSTRPISEQDLVDIMIALVNLYRALRLPEEVLSKKRSAQSDVVSLVTTLESVLVNSSYSEVE